MPATLLACAVLPLLLVGSVHCAAHQPQEAQAAVAGGTPEPTAVPVAAVAIPAVNASAAAALPGPPELPSTAPMLGPGSASAEPRAESKVEPMAMTTVPPSPPVLEAQEVPDQPTCVHLDEALCPPAGELCRCKVINRTTTVLCCGITRQLQLRESLNCQGLEGANITGLHARNITLASLDVSFLNLTRLHLPHLESLAITDGHISDLHGHLDAKNLACLNLSSNNMVSLSEETFSSLHSLENLDLSGNDLKHVVNFKTDVPELKLDISGNNNVSCPSIMELMKSVQTLNFSHDKNSTCLSPASFSWFNSTAKVPLSSLSLLSKLEQECPQDGTEPCYCTNFRLDIVAGKQPTFSVGVDCSNRRLTSLPPKLPTNTISLNVSSNNISDLSALSMNKAYADIRYFYADDNQITSITALEGSTFINSFVFLSLRNNNISSLPTYILSNVFDRNSYDSRTVLLGRNRLKCDCTTAQQIKMWLNANYKHIPDYNEVLCENMRERVFELDQNKVCTVQSDWTEYVYYLVAAEVLLLILLISKVSYDYWVFKTAGYLPWPASKMPKLPCDWVFES